VVEKSRNLRRRGSLQIDALLRANWSNIFSMRSNQSSGSQLICYICKGRSVEEIRKITGWSATLIKVRGVSGATKNEKISSLKIFGKRKVMRDADQKNRPVAAIGRAKCTKTFRQQCRSDSIRG